MNPGSYLLGLMLFEGSQQLFLLIGRNDVIGNSKENLILFLDMVLQKPEVGLCLIDEGFPLQLRFFVSTRAIAASIDLT